MQITDYSGFIFDLDGVLWRGAEVVPGAPETIARLRRAGKKLAFVTNYAAEPRASQQAKLQGMGIDAQLEEVITSGYACGLYLQENLPQAPVYVFGPCALAEELQEFGTKIVEEQAEAMVVARDNNFSMQTLDRAFQVVRENPELQLLVCSANAVHPGENGGFAPGGGVMVAALEACTGKKPDLIIGKPNPKMMQIALNRFALPASKCVVIGDILTADIVAAQRAEMDSIFVLSGVGKVTDIEKQKINPTHVLHSVRELGELFA